MLTIEFASTLLDEKCACCGQALDPLARIVCWQNNPYAAYYVMLSSKYNVFVLISTGNWSQEGSLCGRVSFFTIIRSSIGNYQVEIGNAKDSPWGTVAVMGRTLDRVEAMSHSSLSDVFHILDRILTEDLLVIAHLNENQ
jgi:hypothetical protein